MTVTTDSFERRIDDPILALTFRIVQMWHDADVGYLLAGRPAAVLRYIDGIWEAA